MTATGADEKANKAISKANFKFLWKLLQPHRGAFRVDQISRKHTEVSTRRVYARFSPEYLRRTAAAVEL
jgi:hypothetical protein